MLVLNTFVLLYITSSLVLAMKKKQTTNKQPRTTEKCSEALKPMYNFLLLKNYWRTILFPSTFTSGS